MLLYLDVSISYVNQFLFSPISEDIAEEIGHRILNGVSTYEPRVKVTNVNVNINEEENQYEECKIS